MRYRIRRKARIGCGRRRVKPSHVDSTPPGKGSEPLLTIRVVNYYLREWFDEVLRR